MGEGEGDGVLLLLKEKRNQGWLGWFEGGALGVQHSRLEL